MSGRPGQVASILQRMGVTSGLQALERAWNESEGAIDVNIAGGDVTIENAEINVDALTDAELRATPVPVVQAASTPTALQAQTADVAVVAGAGRLTGWSMAETTGTTRARAYLRDGLAGAIIACVNLGPYESAADNYGDRGVAIATSIYLDVIEGSVDISVHKAVA